MTLCGVEGVHTFSRPHSLSVPGVSFISSVSPSQFPMCFLLIFVSSSGSLPFPSLCQNLCVIMSSCLLIFSSQPSGIWGFFLLSV